MLPKKYHFISSFDRDLLNKLNHDIGIIYRNYQNRKYKSEEILSIKKFLKERKIKFFLSNDIRLAIKLDLDGAYIPSFNRSFSHLSYSLKKKFEFIGSAHNLKQIREKELQKVSLIFLSSIFKKNINYLGLNKFKLVSNFTRKKIIALGGISSKNYNKIKLTNCFGFAGISFFKFQVKKKGS
jgi:thiamine-phosphate pyrophosphorylase